MNIRESEKITKNLKRSKTARKTSKESERLCDNSRDFDNTKKYKRIRKNVREFERLLENSKESENI